MKSKLIILFKGTLMGLVEIMPGISGGTMALILGVYERLILAISKINIFFLVKVCSGKFKEAWNHADCTFLFLLVLGSLIGIMSLSSVLLLLINQYPLFLKSLFSGLLLTSLLFEPLKPMKINKKFLLGSIFALLIFGVCLSIPPIEIKEVSLLYVFFGGSIAVCAFILPGISGSFILLLLGLYPILLVSINELNLVFLSTLVSGGLLGLLLFINVIKKAYKEYRQELSGFFYSLVLLSVPLIWQRHEWEVDFLDYQILFIEIIIGLFFGIFLSLLLKRLNSIFQDN